MQKIINIFFLIIDFFYSTIPLWTSGLKSKSYVYTEKGRRKKLDLYLPTTSSSASPVIIYLHGGGWMAGSRKMIQPAAFRQVRRGYAVASISYSFSPRTKWPTQAYEVKAAIRWLRKNALELGLDKDNFCIWGISAGGHIASIIGATCGTKELEGDLGNPDQSSDVKGVISWYGISDFLQMGNNGFDTIGFNVAARWLIGSSIHKNVEKTDLANPIKYLNSGTPPFYLLHGTRDKIVNVNQSELLYDALLKNEIDATFISIPGFYHGDYRLNRDENVEGMEAFLIGFVEGEGEG